LAPDPTEWQAVFEADTQSGSTRKKREFVFCRLASDECKDKLSLCFDGSVADMQKDKLNAGLWFPNWSQVLEVDRTLTAGVREGYRRCIVG